MRDLILPGIFLQGRVGGGGVAGGGKGGRLLMSSCSVAEGGPSVEGSLLIVFFLWVPFRTSHVLLFLFSFS